MNQNHKIKCAIKDVIIIKKACNTYKELHGDNFTVNDVLNNVLNNLSNNMSEFDVIKLICENTGKTFISAIDKNKPKYGLFVARAQPYHKGHQEIINEILLDGLTPIIVLGSSNEDRDKLKNPLTYAQRKELIRLTLPNVPIVFVRGMDYENWDNWWVNLQQEIFNTLYKEFDYNGVLNDDIVLYSHNKEVDRTSFSFNGRLYENTFYTDIFIDQGFNLREVEFVKRNDVKIDANARDIRDNIEGLRHLLDARIYCKLKEWGWGTQNDI